MIRTQRSAFLATTALAIVAVTVAGCGNPSQYPHSRDSYGNTKTSTTKTYASPTVASTLAPSGTTTVVASTQPTTTVLVPARPATTTTVLVPATTVSPNVTTVGSTVLVPATQVPASTTAVYANDVDFMARASQFNATEIALSRVAYQRAQSAAVRAFAMETINDHRRMSNDLDDLALRRNVSLAWTPSPAGSRAVDELEDLNGWAVDRTYLAQIIADHDAAAALYASQSNLATDVTLRSSAGGDAVDLRNRRDEAIRLQNDID